jgi:hypothetical protein
LLRVYGQFMIYNQGSWPFPKANILRYRPCDTSQQAIKLTQDINETYVLHFNARKQKTKHYNGNHGRVFAQKI